MKIIEKIYNIFHFYFLSIVFDTIFSGLNQKTTTINNPV